MKNYLIYLLPMVFLCLGLQTENVNKIQFDDGSKIREEFILNGSTVKEATFLAIKVYKLFLYVKSKKKVASEIINSDMNKLIRFDFLMSVSSRKLGESWNNDVQSACQGNCKATLLNKVKDLSLKLPDINKGDRVEYYLIGKDHLKVYVNSKIIGEINEIKIGEIVLKAIIGHGAPKKMENELLGID